MFPAGVFIMGQLDSKRMMIIVVLQFTTVAFLFIYSILLCFHKIVVYDDRIESIMLNAPLLKKTIYWNEDISVSEKSSKDVLAGRMPRYDRSWRISLKTAKAKIDYSDFTIENAKELTLLIADKVSAYKNLLQEIAAGMK